LPPHRIPSGDWRWDNAVTAHAVARPVAIKVLGPCRGDKDSVEVESLA
jgi:hypothetical protein